MMTLMMLMLLFALLLNNQSRSSSSICTAAFQFPQPKQQQRHQRKLMHYPHVSSSSSSTSPSSMLSSTTQLQMTTQLALDNSLVTLISFFPTKNEQHQRQVICIFEASLMSTLRKEPGFVVCHMFTSLDGKAVALYEQWETLDELNVSYDEESVVTAIRKGLKFVLEVDDNLVNRSVYNIIRVGGTTGPMGHQSQASIYQFKAATTTADSMMNEQTGGQQANVVALHQCLNDPSKMIQYSQWMQETLPDTERQQPGTLFALAASHLKE